MNRERLRATLARDEGLNLSRHDVEGIDHIGYGFNLDIEWHDDLTDYLGVADEDEIQEISQEQADYILDWHIDEMTKTISKRFPAFNNLSPLRQEIIMNMRFNLGSGGLRKFKKMWEAIEAENWHAAGEQMLDSLWAKQVGERASQLSKVMIFDDENFLFLDQKWDTEIDAQDVAVLGDSLLTGATDQELLSEIARRFGLASMQNPLKDR